MKQLRTIACALILALSSAADAQPSSELVLRLLSRAAEISDDVGGKLGPDKSIATLQEFLDIEEMGQRAFGDLARLNPQHRVRYLTAYRAFLGRLLYRHLNASKIQRARLLGVRRIDRHTELVATRILFWSGKEVDAQWYVNSAPDPRVIDLVYDGVLFSEAQRRQFQAILDTQAGDLTALPSAIDLLSP